MQVKYLASLLILINIPGLIFSLDSATAGGSGGGEDGGGGGSRKRTLKSDSDGAGADFKLKHKAARVALSPEQQAKVNQRLFTAINTDRDNDLLMAILAEGADINALNELGYSPLLALVDHPGFSNAALRTLLNADANPNVANSAGNTVLALVSGNLDRLFMDRVAGENNEAEIIEMQQCVRDLIFYGAIASEELLNNRSPAALRSIMTDFDTTEQQIGDALAAKNLELALQVIDARHRYRRQFMDQIIRNAAATGDNLTEWLIKLALALIVGPNKQAYAAYLSRKLFLHGYTPPQIPDRYWNDPIFVTTRASIEATEAKLLHDIRSSSDFEVIKEQFGNEMRPSIWQKALKAAVLSKNAPLAKRKQLIDKLLLTSALSKEIDPTKLLIELEAENRVASINTEIMNMLLQASMAQTETVKTIAATEGRAGGAGAVSIGDVPTRYTTQGFAREIEQEERRKMAQADAESRAAHSESDSESD